MALLICPGMHDSALTHAFLAAMELTPDIATVFPSTQAPPYSPLSLLAFFQRSVLPPSTESIPNPANSPPLHIIAFSAGVVGAIGAAHLWQLRGGKIAWLIALDGWGAPAWANFPVYRLSHDRFTHWSSHLLGGSPSSFYADPGVEHLDLWRSPHQTPGWQTLSWGLRTHTTAANFIKEILTQSFSDSSESHI